MKYLASYRHYGEILKVDVLFKAVCDSRCYASVWTQLMSHESDEWNGFVLCSSKCILIII